MLKALCPLGGAHTPFPPMQVSDLEPVPCISTKKRLVPVQINPALEQHHKIAGPKSGHTDISGEGGSATRKSRMIGSFSPQFLPAMSDPNFW